jgi:hypothetical protein
VRRAGRFRNIIAEHSVLHTFNKGSLGIWTFLVGSEEDTRTLVMLIGIRYSRNPNSGDIMHDNKIVLLNGAGEVTKELFDLDASIEDFR